MITETKQKYRVVQTFLHLPEEGEDNGNLIDELFSFAREKGIPLSIDEEGFDRFSESIIYDRSQFDCLQVDC